MKILVIRFSSLGDIILLSCIFREIKKQFSDANIVFMTSREFEDIYKKNPHIAKIYAFDRKDGVGELFRARRYLKQQKFDLVIDAHRSLRSYLVCFQNTKKKTVVNKRTVSRYLQIYWKNKPKEIVNQRDAYLQWLKKYNKKEEINNKTEFFLNPKDQSEVRNFFYSYYLDSAKLIVIAMGAKYFNKCWPAVYWHGLVEKMKKEKLQVVLIGSANDKKTVPNYSKVAAKCSLDLTGKLSLQESAALLAKAKLLVCSDSAPLHLAEAVGTPVVAIFGPTTAGFGFAPFLANSHLLEVELACKPCSAHGAKKCINKLEKECMKLVRVEDVWNAVDNILNNKKE